MRLLHSLSSPPPSTTLPLSPLRTILSLSRTAAASTNPSSAAVLTPHHHNHLFSRRRRICSALTSLSSPPTPLLVAYFSHRDFAVRCASSVSPSGHTVEWNEPVSCSEVGGGEAVDEKSSVSVKAYFFSTSIDLRSLMEQNKPNFIPTSSRMTNYIVLKFGDLYSSPGLRPRLSGSACYYMVVFQYGSTVLFNVPDHQIDGYLKIVRQHAVGLLPETRKDEYEVKEKQTLNTWMQGGLDYIMLQYLDIDGIRTIGSVLGQSIALDYYVRQVDGIVAEFTDINRELEKTGNFQMERKKLFQLVGKANSNLADVILKLGLFERCDIAWKDAKYAQIWEYLRDEFELTQRFANLDFKLKFVEHNICFLQETLQNKKSDLLEWVIIILISVEILISIFDLIQRSAVPL